MQNGLRGICLNNAKIVPLKDKPFNVIPKKGLGALFSNEILVGPYFGCIHFLDQKHFKPKDTKTVYKKITLKAINNKLDDNCNYTIASFDELKARIIDKKEKQNVKLSTGDRLEVTKYFYSSRDAFTDYHGIVKHLVNIVPLWFGVEAINQKKYKLIVQYALTDKNVYVVRSKLFGYKIQIVD